MSTVVTEAIVLHAFDYLEASRIIRLMTRESGIQSVLARGARNSRKRFGSGVDLFAQGTVELDLRESRELQTLLSFEISRTRSQLAEDVGRFTAGSMIAEMALRASSDVPAPGVFDAVERALDSLALADSTRSISAGLGGAWQIIAALGFTPALDLCANCHADLDAEAPVAFSHSAGGSLCARCARLSSTWRMLPADARSAVRSWIDGEHDVPSSSQQARAHQRLLREFFLQHVAGDRELKAYAVWERGAWTAA